MSDESLLKSMEVADLLGVNPKSVRRYSNKGLLSNVSNGHEKLFDLVEVLKLHLALRIDSTISNSMKRNLYVMTERSVPLEDIAQFSDIDFLDVSPNDYLDALLHLYRNQRYQLMNSYGATVSEIKNNFSIYECRDGLSLNDSHVIYDLIDYGLLEQSKTNSKRVLISKQSFKDYLGDYSNQFLFRSKDVSSKSKLTINTIDKIAKSNDIGFKIKESPQGNYLFSNNDLSLIQYAADKK